MTAIATALSDTLPPVRVSRASARTSGAPSPVTASPNVNLQRRLGHRSTTTPTTRRPSSDPGGRRGGAGRRQRRGHLHRAEDPRRGSAATKATTRSQATRVSTCSPAPTGRSSSGCSGRTPTVLHQQAERVRDVMADVDGVVDPRVDLPDAEPTIEIEVDLDKAQAFGVSPGSRSPCRGDAAAGHPGRQRLPGAEGLRRHRAGRPEHPRGRRRRPQHAHRPPDGGHVRLDQVADVRVAETPSVIERDAVSRHVDVQAGVERSQRRRRRLGHRGRASRRSTSRSSTTPRCATSGTDQEIGAGRVLGFAVGAAMAAFLLLQAAFRSWRLAALVFVTLPLSLVGRPCSPARCRAVSTSRSGRCWGSSRCSVWRRARWILVRGPGADRWSARARTDAPGSAYICAAPSVSRRSSRRPPRWPLLLSPFVILGSRPGLETGPADGAGRSSVACVTSTFVTLFVLPALSCRRRPVDTRPPSRRRRRAGRRRRRLRTVRRLGRPSRTGVTRNRWRMGIRRRRIGGAADGSAARTPEHDDGTAYHPADRRGGRGLRRQAGDVHQRRGISIGLESATAQQDGEQTVVPYAALIYDREGEPWVYTVVGDLTFVRRGGRSSTGSTATLLAVRRIGARCPCGHGRGDRGVRRRAGHRRRSLMMRAEALLMRRIVSRSACASGGSSSSRRSPCWPSGLPTSRNTKVDVFPEFAPPRVEIQTIALGQLLERGRAADHRADREPAERDRGSRRRCAPSRSPSCPRSG